MGFILEKRRTCFILRIKVLERLFIGAYRGIFSLSTNMAALSYVMSDYTLNNILWA